jgi:ABC-type lipoprotein export system ATPase subunit
MKSARRDRFRVDHTGYIFQQFNLLPFLSVRENVELPCHFSTAAPSARPSATAVSTRPPPPCSRTWV